MRCVFKGLQKAFVLVWIFIDGIAFIILLCFIIILIYWHYEMVGWTSFISNKNIIHVKSFQPDVINFLSAFLLYERFSGKLSLLTHLNWAQRMIHDEPFFSSQQNQLMSNCGSTKEKIFIKRTHISTHFNDSDSNPLQHSNEIHLHHRFCLKHFVRYNLSIVEWKQFGC